MLSPSDHACSCQARYRKSRHAAAPTAKVDETVDFAISLAHVNAHVALFTLEQLQMESGHLFGPFVTGLLLDSGVYIA